jgi:hypothetical protein
MAKQLLVRLLLKPPLIPVKSSENLTEAPVVAS